MTKYYDSRNNEIKAGAILKYESGKSKALDLVIDIDGILYAVILAGTPNFSGFGNTPEKLSDYELNIDDQLDCIVWGNSTDDPVLMTIGYARSLWPNCSIISVVS